MIAALICLQFPEVEVTGEAEVINSGNFLVQSSEGVVLSPYGFIDTAHRKRMLLERVASLKVN